jgi:hypothetical protein
MNISIQAVAKAISANSWDDMECHVSGAAQPGERAGADTPPDDNKQMSRPRDPYFYIELI